MSEKKRADGTWYTSFRYTTWDGKRKQKKKEGFKTLGAAKKYREEFLKKVTGNCDMKFSAMVELYLADCKHRLRPTSIVTKESVLNTHILPYLGDMAINEIPPSVIRSWHNQLLDKKFSDTYYRTINTQASAVFNYAVRYYNLSFNPVTRCDPIGKKKSADMLIWTVDEFKQFYSVLTRPQTKMVFELLFWTGIREGELLALTLNDFDFEARKVHITKTFVTLNGEELIQPPKTPKSNRFVPVPQFVLDDLKAYVNMLYDYEPDERLFPYTKYFIAFELRRNCEAAGVKKIRVHDLRHSYTSMLIEQGFETLLISELLGHENVSTTLETYAHLYPNKHDIVREKLDKLK